ncbi:hypothetical protein KVU_PA0223 (plasmid) [Ketogulonicigenium vulgare WSH-001]|uniref:Uncharacterized protein n=1 Tax=Ketogulonicigenium vulgare (strain WSH-001) TaxID=759362 RepID=F9YB88_KETVW|nr:hypothetical protein KVU_PA0223 [Ketogulonicigenium vulgare WSH-001]
MHGHHRGKGAGGFLAACHHRLGQGAGGDLPRDAPPVLAPAAFTFLPAIADNGVPIQVGFGLILGQDLERERLVLFEHRAAVQAHAGHAHDGEIHHQHLALFAGWIVARRALDAVHRGVRKDRGIEIGRRFGILVEPEADGVFGDRHVLPRAKLQNGPDIAPL